MTEFAIGQRVIVNGSHDGQCFENERGVIATKPGWLKRHTCVRFDREREYFHDGHEGDNHHHWFFDPLEKGYSILPVQTGPSTYLNGLDALSDLAKKGVDEAPMFTVGSHSDNPKEPKMQERFLTAYKDGPDFTLTGDDHFNTQRDADNHANAIAASEADVCVVVLKVVSRHSSRIVVTTEAA